MPSRFLVTSRGIQMTLPSDVFSCCCDHGFELMEPEAGIWYQLGGPRLFNRDFTRTYQVQSNEIRAGGRNHVWINQSNTLIKQDFDGAAVYSYTGSGFGPQAVALKDDDAVVVTQPDTSTGRTGVRFSQVSASGATDWQDIVTDPSTNVSSQDCCADASGNSAWVGYYYNSSLNSYGQLIRYYNSSGVLQWSVSKPSPASGDQDHPTCCCFDSSGNLYVGRRNTGGVVALAFLEKYNSSGVSQWTKNPGDVWGLAMDPYDNLYAIYDSGGGFFKTVKYSGASHGTIEWDIFTGWVSNAIFSFPNTTHPRYLAIPEEGGIFFAGSDGSISPAQGLLHHRLRDGSRLYDSAGFSSAVDSMGRHPNYK